jgi:hypothetical protein
MLLLLVLFSPNTQAHLPPLVGFFMMGEFTFAKPSSICTRHSTKSVLDRIFVGSILMSKDIVFPMDVSVITTVPLQT